MRRSRRLVAAVCVIGWLTLIWSMSWLTGQFIPEQYPKRFGYRPDPAMALVDLGSVQREWPNSLVASGEKNRLLVQVRDARRNAPAMAVSPAVVQPAEESIDLTALLASADPAEGQAKARACLSCHAFEPGGPDRVGPNLWGVVERDIAARPGFAYSAAMAREPGTWTHDLLFEYLASPARAMPGTKMSFAGLRRPEDRAAVIKYLMTLHN